MQTTAMGVAVALAFRSRWRVAVDPVFADRLGRAVLNGPPSKIGFKAQSLDEDRAVAVVTTVDELRSVLLEPLTDD